MELVRARLLTSPMGRAALDEVDSSWASLPLHTLATRLRERYPRELASAVGEQLTLRQRCRDRLGALPLRFLTADGIEVMTRPEIAVRRGKRLAESGVHVLLDLTCGIGGDLIACADAGLSTYGLDQDASIATIAAANVPAASVVQGAAVHPPFDLTDKAVLIDPARRNSAGRTFDPDAFSPPFDVGLDLMRQARLGVMKTAPGINHDRIPEWCELEFVQFGRTLQEAALWSGEGATPGLRRAVLLPGGVEVTSDEPESHAMSNASPAILYDPQSCVTRAGLVRQLAARLGAGRLDEKVAYLGAQQAGADPLCVGFEVLERVPFSVSRLKLVLRERRWRPAEVRRRAFPIEPDELLKLIGRMEGEAVTLICTTIGQDRVIFICRPLIRPRNPSIA